MSSQPFPSQFAVVSAAQLLACLDLTSLGEDDRRSDIDALCRRAGTGPVPAAAVCVYPEHVAHARATLDGAGLSAVRVATVVNFPDGGEDPARVERECRRALAAGADEVDAVLPYRALLRGDRHCFAEVANACRQACRASPLKLILETGMLVRDELIAEASALAIAAGADFIKTSTGKVAVNATPQAARIMLAAIARNGRGCGFKAAGGIRNLQQAQQYAQLHIEALGAEAFSPTRFRIGASSLLEELIAGGRAAAAPANPAGY